MPLMLTHLPLPNCLSNNLPPLHPLLPILPRRTLISLPLHRQQRLPPCIKPRTPDQPRRRNERETLHPRRACRCVSNCQRPAERIPHDVRGRPG
ncbi:hypothetical protein HBH69_009830 [Parastagonospora nodorum]|nr:hypothetical protein HBH69_009830 [Parastagonospora nodorum]KAH6290300.1 hypothetical protein HBI39_203630 [Parastagonospora nodorum]